MQASPVQLNGETFRYILTVHDVFSRYIWLRLLTRKTSKLVADHLSSLYREFGPPRVLQCDNGGEFKKCVESLCRNLEVEIVRGSPYQPRLHLFFYEHQK